MTRLFLAAGVAAMALAAPAAAQRDGKGGDKAQVQRGGGGGGQRAQQQRPQRVERQAQRPQRMERQAQRAERPQRMERIAQRAERPQRVERQAQRVERQAQRMERPQRVERQAQRVERQAQRIDRRDRQVERVANRVDRLDVREQRVANRIDRRDVRDQRVANRVERDILRQRDVRFGDGNVRIANWDGRNRFASTNGCPPGLAMKNNGCMPPGQLKKQQLVGSVIPATYRDSVLPLALRDLYRDNDDYYYRYGDGYVYRVDRGSNLVNSLLPLLGAGYTVGQAFPTSYMNSFVPSYYQPFYNDTSYSQYRYANGYIYEIDPYTGLIADVDPAYGYGYGVGQMWPSSYSTYNVPYQYRDLYYDTDDYYYRYAPGAIYQVDAGSNLITAVASLLTGGFSVGQQLPLGYDTYNVPYAYRSQYYDTPDNWYRYNNGYIYQVDPTTRLITAIVQALT